MTLIMPIFIIENCVVRGDYRMEKFKGIWGYGIQYDIDCIGCAVGYIERLKKHFVFAVDTENDKIVLES